MIPDPTNTLECRLEKLEREVRGLQVLCRAQKSPRTINVICFTRECHRLKAAFEIAEGARASGHDVNLFLRLWAMGNGGTLDGPLPDRKSWIRGVLDWMLSTRLPPTSLSTRKPGGVRRLIVRQQARDGEVEVLRHLVDQAQQKGVKVFEWGPRPRVGHSGPEDWIDLELEGWFSLEALLSLASKGGATLFL